MSETIVSLNRRMHKCPECGVMHFMPNKSAKKQIEEKADGPRD